MLFVDQVCLLICSLELFYVLSRSLNRDKENITLENNNVLENFAENSLNNMNNAFKTTKIYWYKQLIW